MQQQLRQVPTPKRMTVRLQTTSTYMNKCICIREMIFEANRIQMSHHKNHAGTFPNRAAASHKSDYEDEYSDHNQKRGWRKVA